MPASDTLRAFAEEARAAAAAVLTRATLFSVLVDLAENKSVMKPVRYQFGFQELLDGLILGPRLRTCWVNLSVNPRSVALGASGTFGRKQFKELASIQGADFPPPPLDLDELRLETVDVLRVLEEHSPFGSRAGLGTVQLSVFRHAGHLAWRALHEVEGVGFRTVFLDAGDGQVLYEKVDWYRPDSPR